MAHKKTNRTVIILSVFFAVLAAAFILQGRQLNQLKAKAEEKRAAENTVYKQVGSIPDEEYNKKIKKLENEIVTMQKQLESQEETLADYKDKADSKKTEEPVNTIVHMDYTSGYMDFFEGNNYPAGTIEKLNDIYVERNNAMNKYFNDMRKARSQNVQIDAQESRRQHDKIQSEFNEKLKDLLTEDGAADLKEYEKRGSERSFLDDFQMMLGGEKLDEEKKKELIVAMYNERQDVMAEESKKTWPHAGVGPNPDRETLAKIRKESYERGQKRSLKIYERYGSAAKGILSESQMKQFEGFVNMRKISLVSDNVFIPDTGSDED